jgi:hypothetical protein
VETVLIQVAVLNKTQMVVGVDKMANLHPKMKLRHFKKTRAERENLVLEKLAFGAS